MGNSYLRDLCNIDKISEDKIKGCKCAIDGHNWLYKYMTISAEYNNVKDFKVQNEKHPEYIGILMGASKLIEYNIEPIIIFDGGYNNLKEDELKNRKDKKKEAEEKKNKTNDKIEKAKFRARTQKVTESTVKHSKKLLDILGINYMEAPQSAESQAAYMCKDGTSEYVISDDYDTIVFGSPFTLRNFTSSSRSLEMISLKDTLNDHKINYKDLINAYILCGTDYNEGVNGIGPKTSIKHVKKYSDMEELMEKEDISVDNYKEIYNLFEKPKVKKDYKKPVDINPDLEKLKDYLPKNVLNNRNVKNSIEKIERESKKSKLSDF